MASKLFPSLAATAFAAMLFNFFLKRRSRAITGGEAHKNAAANDGTAGCTSSSHTSTGVPEMATSSGANKNAAASDGTARGDSGTNTSTGVPEMATSSGANKDAAANDGTPSSDSNTHTSTEAQEMATSLGANEDAAANDTAGGGSGTHTSTGIPEMATSSGANKDVAANNGTARGASGTPTTKGAPAMATSSGANKDAAANDGTAGGDSCTHTSTGAPEMATLSGANKDAAANDGTANGDSNTHSSPEAHEMATSSGANRDATTKDNAAGGDSSTHTSTVVPEMATSSGANKDASADDGTAGGDSSTHTSTRVPEMEASKDATANDGTASGDSNTHTSTEAHEMATSSGANKDAAANDGTAEGASSTHTSLEDQGYDFEVFLSFAGSDTREEVRYQMGGYAEAFLSHEKKRRYGEETICQWKAALNAVGAINGWDLHNKTDRREGEFAKEVTQVVFNELKKANLEVSDCFVNVDNHVNAIMEMIGVGTSETRIIGIYGMGGVGKTTIAKMIYNELSNNFEHHCFLSNIREMSERKGIEYLQNQLIFDILKVKETDIKNIEDGTKTIKARLRTKKVLLFLDDVDHKKHMDALVDKHWYGTGSKLIITTRNKEILEVPKVDKPYEVSGMDNAQSLQLFRKYAFKTDYPSKEYDDQSKRAIAIARGLPLALEVIGSLLWHTEKEMWDATLKMLESVPRDKILSKLKISYDALDFRQKRIFLDIACLFVGYDKDILVRFWDHSYLFPEEAMKVLQDMSLIKIDEDNEVWMHDQLRDLGREMVREKSDTKIEKQSRVWDSKEGLNLLRHKGKKKVEALRLQLDHQWQYHFTNENFESLSNLRFLEVDGSMENDHAEERPLGHESTSNVLKINIIQENSHLLPQLRWLSWHEIPPTFKIRNFLTEDLVILDLFESEITDDWNGWSHIEEMKNLKVLNLSDCNCLERTPIFSADSNLERLNLSDCQSLIEIDKSIRRLKCLVSLDLSYCMKLQKLPDELGNGLASLEYLSLFQCRLLRRLPESIGNLKLLNELNISGTRIKKIPYSIKNLKNLKVAKMRGSAISKIPAALWMDGMLEEIEASGKYRAEQVNIGNCISKSKSLRILKLWSVEIHALSMLPESLVELQLWKLCMDIFPDLSNLTNLKGLKLWFCSPDSVGRSYGPVADPLPRWIGNLTKLESLHLRFDCETASPTDLSLPPQLKSLCLRGCNLDSLLRLPSSLSSLSLEHCNSHCSMEDLSNLKQLSSLKIENSAIVEIQGLSCLENLRDLELHGLGHVKILPDLRNLNKLSSLKVQNCDNLVEIQGELPRSLCILHIYRCGMLQTMPDLSSFMGKKEVKIDYCKNLNMEAILGYARKSLQDLQLEDVEQLQILCDLSNLRNTNELTSLQVRGCGNLVKIQGELPQSLKKLEIHSCKSLQELPNMSCLIALREICICECGDLVEIQDKLPQSLEKLEIYSCKSLQKLPVLSNSMRLREVCICECGDLVEIQGKLPQSLEKLEIYSCKSLQKLPVQSNSIGLREVCIRECGDLVEIQGKLSQSLEKLIIDRCKSLRKLPYLSSLIGLQEFCVVKCGDLVKIQGKLPLSLEKLKINNCKSLRKLPYMWRFMRLRKANYHNH
ncbi:hypothetical protein BT93_H2400 [Corymbia citriodora subsp. variegata]|nr:hypothetical protein BT93_H2400 [Corymbia citriodora subsp. variegata]